jgi:hypothetical protein
MIHRLMAAALALATLLQMGLTSVRAGTTTVPEVWMCRSGITALADDSQWPCTAGKVDVVKIFIDEIPTVPITDLRAFVQTLQAHQIKIAIELAGLADWHAQDGGQAAALSFADEYAKVQPLITPVAQGGAGGRIAYLDFDGPVRRMLYPFGQQQSYQTLDSATDQLVVAMQLWRGALPNVQFMLLTNFPNWGWKGQPAYNNLGLNPGPLGYGDYMDELTTAPRKAAHAGIPFLAVTVDNPYDYAIGAHSSNQPGLIQGIDWIARLADLEAECQQRGLGINMIYNSERAGNQGTGSDALYTTETIAFVNLHLGSGATPERAVIESWYFYPTAYTPESTPYTMTNLIKRAMPLLKGVPACP